MIGRADAQTESNAGTSLRPGSTGAVIVLCGYAALIAACLTLAVIIWPAWIGSIVLLVVGLALVTFLPGRRRLPANMTILDHDLYPEVYGLVEGICAEADLQSPDFVAVTTAPGMFTTLDGWPIIGRRGVVLGFPVWDPASAEARVGLLTQVLAECSIESGVRNQATAVAVHIFDASGVAHAGDVIARDTQDALAEFSGDTEDEQAGAAAALVGVVVWIASRLLGFALRPIARRLVAAEKQRIATASVYADHVTARFCGSAVLREVLRLQVLAPNRFYWAIRSLDVGSRKDLVAAPLDEIEAGMRDPEPGLYERLLDQEGTETHRGILGVYPLTAERLSMATDVSDPPAAFAALQEIALAAGGSMVSVRAAMNRPLSA